MIVNLLVFRSKLHCVKGTPQRALTPKRGVSDLHLQDISTHADGKGPQSLAAQSQFSSMCIKWLHAQGMFPSQYDRRVGRSKLTGVLEVSLPARGSHVSFVNWQLEMVRCLLHINLNEKVGGAMAMDLAFECF